MSLLGGRGGRSDDWSTPHLRARARAAERLDEPLAPEEEAWLDDHLAGCPACSMAAADYAGQRLELRALRDRTPVPPRDLWARTAAAIEREAGTGPRRGRRSAQSQLAPYALLVGAVIVAVTIGSLNLANGVPQPTAAGSPSSAGVPGSPLNAAATPLLVDPGSVAYLTLDDGAIQLNHLAFKHVCGPTATGCEASAPTTTQTIGPVSSPESVFGAANGDGPLVVVSNNQSGGKVYAIAMASQTVTPTASPSDTTATPPPSAIPSPTPTPTVPASAPPSQPVEPSQSPSDTASPSPSDAGESLPPATPGTAVEIARDLTVLDATAAYAPDGSAFAFTARPINGSHGTDIYLWHVGDARAAAITSDHRSVFGSWAGDSIVGSTVTASQNGRLDRPKAFILRPGSAEPKQLEQIGLAWRPVVDPAGRAAVYWSGRLEPSPDGLSWIATRGNLVVGRWDDVTAASAAGDPAVPADGSAKPDKSADPVPSTEPSPDASATARDDAGQPVDRSETTIAAGPLADWDARWDETGTRLAIWIADPQDPGVGRLTLYVVDPFDGRIDQLKPPLVDEPALAGFAISKGHLAWASPPAAGASESSVLVLAWTGDDFGKVESAPGDVILVR
jgi:hypothetical protein